LCTGRTFDPLVGLARASPRVSMKISPPQFVAPRNVRSRFTWSPPVAPFPALMDTRYTVSLVSAKKFFLSPGGVLCSSFQADRVWLSHKRSCSAVLCKEYCTSYPFSGPSSNRPRRCYEERPEVTFFLFAVMSDCFMRRRPHPPTL